MVSRESAISAAIFALGCGALLAAVLRLVVLPWEKALDEKTLIYLAVSAALFLVRDLKAFSFGNQFSLEFRQLAEQTEKASQLALEARDTAKTAKNTAESTAILGVGKPMPRADLAVVNVHDDPQKGRWGGSPVRGDRLLEAEVERSEASANIFRVVLRVLSRKPSNPLEGTVRFHLHPTFQNPEVDVPVIAGIAQLTLLAWGAFTVGAEADATETTLELDLSELPDAPREFKER